MDVSRQPKKEKFSFIYTLSLSGSSNLLQQARYPEPNLNSGSTFTQQELPAKSVSKDCERLNSSNLSKYTNSEETSESSAVSSALATPDDTVATITAQWYQIEPSASSYDLELSAIAPSSGITEAFKERSQPHRNYLSKILLICSCGYLIVVMGWLFGHHSEYLSVILRGKQPVVLSKSDAEFIDYMERSLSAIDNQASQQDLVAERDSQVVYVPVFTPQASAPTTPPPVTFPPTSMANEPTTAISQPLPLALPQESLKIPSPPPLPAPTPRSDAQVSDYSTATATARKRTSEHTLIGILELGDRSAALFEIEGAIEQVSQGQEIHSSGWILDSLNDQKVQISYQGEVHTLSVGEKF